MNPLKTLADVLPFLGEIVGAGTMLVSLMLAISWSLFVIAVAWIFYRPLLGLFLVALGVGTLFFLRHRHTNVERRP